MGERCSLDVMQIRGPVSQARMPFTTFSSTSVSRKSPPWNRYVSRVWSMPRQCRIVALQVVDVDGVLDDVVAEVVGLAVDDAAA